MENQTIIVKKIKKGGHGHHGGAWKVAFADFAVAMMAFFLLLWLIASTTKEEQAGLSEYFSPPTQGLADGSGTSEDIIDMGGGQKISQGDDSKQDAREPTVDEIREVIEAERKQLESLMQELKMTIENSEAIKPFKDQLLLDITPDGLRIQIVDKEGRPMFDSGVATMKPYSRTILREIAKVINKVPNRLSLTGHTDATKFVSRKGYSNWELSADRANASRRELIAGGYDADKIAKVVGLASMVPFDKDDPRSPVNRRIAIIVLDKAAEEALLHSAQTASDGDETQALLDNDVGGEGGAPVRRFRSAIGDLRVQQVAEQEAREAAAKHEPESEPAQETPSAQDHEPIPVINPIPSLQPIAEPQKPVAKHEKPAHKASPKPGLEKPDYTGMSIAERIKARAEWNKRKAAAEKR
ncbi:Flagellar motor rotation protein MotB [hydrothermal vent metagenome]|uniref:Flagellar motor rotation protein MotB n=1 Tax=hydrothermal vent metagenome TaxID=652676 RepID=A0A3B1B2X7_9ZZZZ